MTTLVSDVASAYFNLLDLDMELEIARRTLGVRQDSLELIRSRERGGLGTLLEVRQGEQLVYGAESDVLVQYQKVREIRGKQELLLATLRDRSRMSRVRYAGGIDPLLNALDAERDLFEAELTLVQTRRTELLAVVQLYRALGGGWRQ
jgi:outer membrane protein TolC